MKLWKNIPIDNFNVKKRPNNILSLNFTIVDFIDLESC